MRIRSDGFSFQIPMLTIRLYTGAGSENYDYYGSLDYNKITAKTAQFLPIMNAASQSFLRTLLFMVITGIMSTLQRTFWKICRVTDTMFSGQGATPLYWLAQEPIYLFLHYRKDYVFQVFARTIPISARAKLPCITLLIQTGNPSRSNRRSKAKSMQNYKCSGYQWRSYLTLSHSVHVWRELLIHSDLLLWQNWYRRAHRPQPSAYILIQWHTMSNWPVQKNKIDYKKSATKPSPAKEKAFVELEGGVSILQGKPDQHIRRFVLRRNEDVETNEGSHGISPTRPDRWSSSHGHYRPKPGCHQTVGIRSSHNHRKLLPQHCPKAGPTDVCD